MLFEGLLAASTAESKLPPLEVRRWIVRAIWAALRSSGSGSDSAGLQSQRGFQDFVARYLPVPLEREEICTDTLLALCNGALTALEKELQEADSHETRQLVDGLATALRFTPTERSLLELSLLANLHRDLQRAIDLVEPVDDEGAAQLFALMLEREEEDILSALHRNNPLRRANGFELSQMCGRPFLFLRFNLSVMRVLRSGTPTVEAVLGQYFRSSPAPRLALCDFEHAHTEMKLLERYLRNALAQGRRGANVLLHGAPGTGKTELVRALAAAGGAQLMEVPACDERKEPLPPVQRLMSYCAAQEVLREREGTVLLFDEVEDIFPDDGEDMMFGRHRSPRDRNKGWVTQVLEDNVRPAFWVSNSIRQMDPAYLRRFDLVIELPAPSLVSRAKLVKQLFAGLPIPGEDLHRLGAEPALVPGHFERLASVMHTLSPSDDEEGAALLQSLSTQMLRAMNAVPSIVPKQPLLPYRSECVNADVDLEILARELKAQPSARLCLHGPSGTGKTEWARQLSSALGCPLRVERISQLKSMYVGQTEQLIAAAFRDAEAAGAVLLIDEADSLLGNRERASQPWEISMVNEMLTCMERFEGVFIATTNRLDSMDPASARRFDFKVGFGYLKASQVRLLFQDLLEVLGVESGDERPSLAGLHALTPGDFLNVYRQARLIPAARSPAALANLLTQEQRGKTCLSPTRRIGFV